jgi:hypothetical protein
MYSFPVNISVAKKDIKELDRTLTDKETQKVLERFSKDHPNTKLAIKDDLYGHIAGVKSERRVNADSSLRNAKKRRI